MNLEVDFERLTLAHKAVRAELLAERAADGHWDGHVGSSPFATAAAVSALVVAHRSDSQRALLERASDEGHVIEQVVQGDLSELLLESVNWLASQQNPDGGWGDCERARSNIAATMMVQAAFRLTGIPARYADLMVRADDYVDANGGVAGLKRKYSDDRILLATVMTNCALAGMVPWRQVPTLQLELACLPGRWRRNIQLFVPRYVRAVVLAVGRTKFHHNPPKNPISRLLRRSIWKKSVSILEQLQASDDSFMASVPLTAFVVMSLASSGSQNQRIVDRGIEFLLSSLRADSSWPTMPNHAIANTALALNSVLDDAADVCPQPEAVQGVRNDRFESENRYSTDRASNDTATPSDTLPEHTFAGVMVATGNSGSRASERDGSTLPNEDDYHWLLNRQRTEPDHVTEVPAGGWSSGDVAGSLPNASTTASALLALVASYRRTRNISAETMESAAGRAVVWLLELQNDDGGWATFYRDDALLSRDESANDVTAEVLRALAAWRRAWRAGSSAEAQRRWLFIDERAANAIENAWKYLESHQQVDGSFVPMWFGNELQPNQSNPVFGTAQALFACAELERLDFHLAARAASWLVAAQHANGGWGPPRTATSYSAGEKDGFQARRTNEAMARFCSVEETSLAISALMPLAETNQQCAQAVSRGLTWLTTAIEQDAHRLPATIGFSLAKLWYHERLYPLAFAAGALSRAVYRARVATPATSHAT